MNPKLAVVAFPGNNCEIETLRAAQRAGFDTEILRWNTDTELSSYDAFVFPGGFSFEDRGRSGVVCSREFIFDSLRKEAQKGKVILGICNGAQMIVESGLIPVGNDPLPFALAHNIRRNSDGKVLGSGFFNTWVHITPERKDTAFTHKISKKALHIPIAHGEGRFTSVKKEAAQTLKTGEHVAFRYCDEKGNTSSDHPINPNGSMHATAGIVNTEGTICAMMPHPERFFDSCDGDSVFTSMHAWIMEKKGPKTVVIGDLSQHASGQVPEYTPPAQSIRIEKKDIITDNEAYTLSRTANTICRNNIPLKKSILYEVRGDISKEVLLKTGLFLNPNKEMLMEPSSENTFKIGVINRDDDESRHLSDKISAELGTDIFIKITKVWHFAGWKSTDIQKLLNNNLLANPNSAETMKIEL